MPAASEAEVPRSLEVGTNPCMTLTDLGHLQVRVKCMDHRSMSFLSRFGTVVRARDDARIRRTEAPPAQGDLADRQVASGHTARGARPAIFTLVSNIDIGTSFRVDGHDGAPAGCRSSEFRDALGAASNTIRAERWSVRDERRRNRVPRSRLLPNRTSEATNSGRTSMSRSATADTGPRASTSVTSSVATRTVNCFGASCSTERRRRQARSQMPRTSCHCVTASGPTPDCRACPVRPTSRARRSRHRSSRRPLPRRGGH